MLTFNITYYNEPHFLIWWYETIKEVVENYNLNVVLQVCDDGSQREPAIKFFEKHQPIPYIKLFRVTKDIGFNSHGARNLLMKNTESTWNVLSDIDRRYPIDTIKKIYYRSERESLKKGNFYKFQNIKDKNSKNNISLNDYIIRKDDFWLSGGYDEEFVNVHWGDRIFFESLLLFLKVNVLRDCYIDFVRHARNVSYGDMETTQYPDDNTLIHPKNFWVDRQKRDELKKFVANRNSTHEGRMSKKVINFEWERIF
jgi:hypothetical protein